MVRKCRRRSFASCSKGRSTASACRRTCRSGGTSKPSEKMKMLEAIHRALRGEAVEGFSMKIPPPVATLIGFEPIKVEEGAAVFRLQARRDKHANPMGTVHGGILCDLADAAIGMACA